MYAYAVEAGYTAPASATYKGLKLGRRSFFRRAWLNHLRLNAIAHALDFDPDPELLAPQIMESARAFCEVLDETPVPNEPVGGIIGRARRLLREALSHGVRYPKHQGPARITFWRRLYEWVRKAAESPRGTEALDLADFPRSPFRSHDFAMRVIGRTSALLLTPVASEGQDSFRHEMSDELNYGLTEARRRERNRILQMIIRSAVAGITTVVVSDLGFGRDLVDSLGLGATISLAAGVTDATIGGVRGRTSSMLAARRQARDWLMTLSALLARYVTWTNESVQASQGGAGVDRLVYLLSALTAREAELKNLPPNEETLLRGLQQVLSTAERAQDYQLQAALIDLETAILYRLDVLPDAINRLLSMVQGVPDEQGPSLVSASEVGDNKQDLTNIQHHELPEAAADYDGV